MSELPRVIDTATRERIESLDLVIAGADRELRALPAWQADVAFDRARLLRRLQKLRRRRAMLLEAYR